MSILIFLILMLSDSFIIFSVKSKVIPSPTFFVFGSLEGEECKKEK